MIIDKISCSCVINFFMTMALTQIWSGPYEFFTRSACLFCRSGMEKLKFLPQGKLGTQFSFQASPFLMSVPRMNTKRFVFEIRCCFCLPFSECIIAGEYKWNNLTFYTRYCCGQTSSKLITMMVIDLGSCKESIRCISL